MIEGLQPYPEYRESGQKWLGRVPVHWDIFQAGQIGRILKGSGGSKEDNIEEGLPCVRYGQLYTKYRGFIHSPTSFIRLSDVSRYTAIYYGDVLFAASGEKTAEIGKSSVNLMRTAMVCGGDVIILRPKMDVYAPFLGYASDCYATANQKATMCRGSTIKHIYPNELRQLKIPLPPPDEQAAIVRFLDHANRKMDGFIRAKRKLIGLLNEQKQAIIHRAVTRGVDHPQITQIAADQNQKNLCPSAKSVDKNLKPSGIPWLGDIPKHWEVRQLRRVCNRIKTGGTPSGVDEKFFEIGGFNWHTPSDFHDAIELGEASRQLSRLGIAEVHIFPVNTILMIGIGATIGKVSISRKPCSCNQQINAIISNPELINMDFLAHYLRTLRNFIVNCGKFTTMPIINQDETKRLPILIPPLSEQVEIASYVNLASKPLTAAITRAEREIALMQEYRTRLTADVVTGKLDVRAAAAKLPEITADPMDGLEDGALEEDETEEEA